MISVIVCSRNTSLYTTLAKNIGQTIGCNFEIVRVDNTGNKYSMCAAYNYGASLATFPYLCFVHEDVTFNTNNWGTAAITHIEAGNALVGVAGSKYKSRCISGWTTGLHQFDHMNIYHRTLKGTIAHAFKNGTGTVSANVVTLDGLWLFCAKKTWQQVKFNEQLLKGFHFYDIDFSLRCASAGKVSVVYDIDIVHFSSGSFNDMWLKQAFIFHDHYKKRLPVYIDTIDVEPAAIEKKVFNFWLKHLKGFNISKSLQLRFLSAGFMADKRRAIKETVRTLFFKPQP